jgi:hypothetical protein
MAVSWTREQRLTARRDSLPLITLAVDRTETHGGGGGGKVAFEGPVPEAVAKSVDEFMLKVILGLQAEGRACANPTRP